MPSRDTAYHCLSRLVANSKQAIVAMIPTAGTELLQEIRYQCHGFQDPSVSISHADECYSTFELVGAPNLIDLEKLLVR